MAPQPSTTTTLNPFAPEYNPVPPGVIPSQHPPMPFLLSPPPSAAFHHPCSLPSSPFLQRLPPHSPRFRSPQVFTYTSSTSQQPFYANYSTYCFTPQNPLSITPPPQADVITHYDQLGRGCTRRRVSRETGRDSFGSSRVDKNGRGFSLGFEKTPKNKKNNAELSKNEKKISTRGMHKEEHRHKVMPLKPEEEKTTIMIKNIPYDCPRKELISLLDDFCLLENQKVKNEGTSRTEDEELFTCAYDFLYLPIDFSTKRSRGFAFVNFTNARAVWKVFDAFHMKNWDFLARNKWPKKIEVVCAKIQGKKALVNHFSQSIFECETDEFLPACFSPPRNGSGQPYQLTVVGNRCPPSH